MKLLKYLALLPSFLILLSCASDPAPFRLQRAEPQEEDPRVGELQKQVDDLQKQLAAKDATINNLTAQGYTSGDRAAADSARITQLEEELVSMVDAEIARGDLEIRRSRDALIISVKDSVLFSPDSPQLRTENLDLLRQLADVFIRVPERIVRVEGNTAVATSSAATLRLYPTSWHLGAARAANVVQFLQEKCSMDPLQLVAASFGEYRPRADNWSEEGKAKNRRVDFVLVPRATYENNEVTSGLQ